jgi:hypothetical protein
VNALTTNFFFAMQREDREDVADSRRGVDSEARDSNSKDCPAGALRRAMSVPFVGRLHM